MGIEHMGREVSMHGEAIDGLDPLIEAKRRDAENFVERRFGLSRLAVLRAAFELLQDRLFAVPARTDDERDAELLAVGAVEAMKVREFLLRESVQSGARLFRR